MAYCFSMKTDTKFRAGLKYAKLPQDAAMNMCSWACLVR